MSGSPPGKPKREILIEITILGAYAKAMAIDAATGAEAFITGPANAPHATLEAAAVKKLEYVLNKKS